MKYLQTFFMCGAALFVIGGGSTPLLAKSAGADPGLSGGGNDGTCLSCHGTRANANGGSVTLSFANGSNYTPGQSQLVTVTIADPTAKVWGFEASPRLSSNAKTGTGTLAPAGDGQTKLAGTSGTIQWITHTTAGIRRGTGTSVQFQFNWTAPSSDVGAVDFYVSANAGNNNNDDDPGDHVYTAKATLTAAAASGGGNTPTISQNGVVNAFSSSTSKFSPGMWVTLYGTNLASNTLQWAGSDFTNNVGPTTLSGVSATVNSKAAVLNYVSPSQVNIQIPTDAGTGTSSVVLTAPGGSSSAYSLNLAQFAPTLNQNAAFKSASGRNYVVAQFSDGAFVGPVGLIAGANFRPAKAGDTIIIYGLGFGPLSTPLSTGQIAPGLDNTANPVTFTIGSATAPTSYAGAAPGFVGAYQFNVVIPSNAGTGDVPLEATVGGVATGQGLYITLQ